MVKYHEMMPLSSKVKSKKSVNVNLRMAYLLKRIKSRRATEGIMVCTFEMDFYNTRPTRLRISVDITSANLMKDFI